MVDATRDVFAHLSDGQVALFYVLAAIATAVFLYGLFLRARKYRTGAGPYTFPIAGLPRRLVAAIWVIAKHTTIGRDDRYVQLSHFLVFWGFVALFAATAILTIDHDFVRPFFPPGFWRGPFFLGYELGADIGGIALVIGVLMLMARRWILRPFRLGYARVDLPAERYSRVDYARGDMLFLVILLGLGLSGFLLEGARIAADRPDFALWSFAGAAVGALLGPLGTEAAEAVRSVTWWAHSLFALAFVAYLPYGKGVHMFLDPATLLLRDEHAGRRLPAAETA